MRTRLLDLLDYNRWATARLVAVTASLDDAGFGRELGGSFPSLRATWLHLLRAEWIWLSRWRGDPDGAAPELDASLAPSALPELWEELWREQRAYTTALSAAELDAPVEIVTRTGIAARLTLEECVQHMVNHASYHRGQIASLLRQLGAEPVGTDLFLYYVARPAVDAAPHPDLP